MTPVGPKQEASPPYQNRFSIKNTKNSRYSKASKPPRNSDDSTLSNTEKPNQLLAQASKNKFCSQKDLLKDDSLARQNENIQTKEELRIKQQESVERLSAPRSDKSLNESAESTPLQRKELLNLDQMEKRQKDATERLSQPKEYEQEVENPFKRSKMTNVGKAEKSQKEATERLYRGKEKEPEIENPLRRQQVTNVGKMEKN